jgi:ABC-2 type transport system ATP-binding protein
MLLQLQGVNKFYGKVHALRGVDLSLPEGSVGLLGPNGAGKSTLLKIMLGLIPATNGSVQVMGFDAASRSLDLRMRIGYMPEQECYVAGLDAVELCTYAGQLCGLPGPEARERAHAVLAYVGLEDKRYLKVHTYSTGQKQRVKLAQALVHDPDLLLLDEPTNGLDPRGRDEMLSLIKELPEKRGCSIMLSSHLLPDVEAVCSSAILLSEGQLIYSGPIEKMRGQEGNLYEVRVKADAARLVEVLRGAGCQADLHEDAIFVRLPPDHDPDLIFSRALEAKIQVRHLEPSRLTLESAFLRLLRSASEHGAAATKAAAELATTVAPEGSGEAAPARGAAATTEGKHA